MKPLHPFVKQQFFSSMKLILFWTGFFLAVKYFQLNIFYTLLLYYIITFIQIMFRGYNDRKIPDISAWFKGCLIFTAIYGTFMWLYSLGFWGITIATILIIILLFVTRWKLYLQSLETIQASIWGKPFKEFSREEWKNRPKIKFVWRKHNG